MRTASMVLGIVGGVLAIIFGFVAFGTAATVGILNPNNYMDGFDDALEQYSDEFADDFAEGFNDGNYDFDFNVNPGAIVDYGMQAAATWFWIAGVLSIIGGALGIVGGALAKKKNVIAGVFMLVGGVLSVFTGYGFISMATLVVGGILALVKEKPAQPAAAYPYSGYQQQPYNPYQQPQQPYNPYQQPQQPYNPYQQPQQPYNSYQQPQQPPQYNPYQPPQTPPAPPQEPEAPKSEE